MALSIKAAIGEPPVEADSTCNNAEDPPPLVVELGQSDRQKHQCTAQQPGTIAAVAGEEGEQGQRTTWHTLSQKQAVMEKPHRHADGVFP